jgi:hypothetical protein
MQEERRQGGLTDTSSFAICKSLRRDALHQRSDQAVYMQAVYMRAVYMQAMYMHWSDRHGSLPIAAPALAVPSSENERVVVTCPRAGS